MSPHRLFGGNLDDDETMEDCDIIEDEYLPKTIQESKYISGGAGLNRKVIL
jgi:hypothetical protein